ncbi:MAG: hypothetical protein ACD_74C00069G0017 [uncultured bacterium]|nr:MAG: hypothetical protein ACD_74C00069G0017 [uncultured bacterium]
MSKIRTPPNLAGLDAFASKAAMVSEPAAPLVSDQKRTQHDQEGHTSGSQKPKEAGKARGRHEKKIEPVPVLERQKPIATSLYFYDEDRKRLEALIKKMGEHAPNKKISASLILRGLLKMSEQANPMDVLAAVKEVSF